MKDIRHSKQRDAIYEYLCSTYEHPTAETVYEKIRNQIPAISLGTVYRNLSLLEEMGKVRKIPQAGLPDRFDADVSNHQHMVCLCCGRMDDLRLDDSKLETEAANASGWDIGSHEVVFYGKCKNCKNL